MIRSLHNFTNQHEIVSSFSDEGRKIVRVKNIPHCKPKRPLPVLIFTYVLY